MEAATAGPNVGRPLGERIEPGGMDACPARAATELASARRTWWLLLGCAGTSLALHMLLIVAVSHLDAAEPSFVGELTRRLPPLTRDNLPHGHLAASAAFCGVLLGLFGVYGLALQTVAGRGSRRLALVTVGAGALFVGIQLASPVVLSTDVFAYTMYGRIVALYQGNPYMKFEPPGPGDPFYPLTYGLPWPSWYGPLWTLLSAGLAPVVGERPGLSVLLFRGIAAVSVLTCGGLIWACLRRLAPRQSNQGLLFFLWNPLVIVESGLSAHNDASMVALLLLGVWLFVCNRRVLGLVSLGLSVLVKLATGPLLPLWLLAAARAERTWAGRLRYLAGVTGLGLMLVAAVLGLVGTGRAMPVVQSAGAAYFYDNNVYQVIYPVLRIALGEEADSARTPVHFYPWWATPERSTSLLAAPRPGAETVERVRPGAILLVTAPEDNQWLRVYSPSTRHKSYVPSEMVGPIERPEIANSDPTLARLEVNPAAGPVGTLANQIIRGATWLVFGAIWLVAAWRVREPKGLIWWSLVVLLAAYWLVATEIWPWYIVWSLALAALIPGSRLAGLAAILSATVLSLYVTIPYQLGPQSWVFTYRSLPAFVLPLVLFGLYQTLQWCRGQKRR